MTKKAIMFLSELQRERMKINVYVEVIVMWFLVNSRHMLSTNNNTHENVMSMRNEQPTAQNEMWMEQIWNEGNLAPPVKASGMFGSVVAVVFQIIFCAEMHANDVFLFFKNYFWHQHIKTIQNIQTILNFNQKTILNFLKTRANRVTKQFLNSFRFYDKSYNQNWKVVIDWPAHLRQTPH